VVDGGGLENRRGVPPDPSFSSRTQRIPQVSLPRELASVGQKQSGLARHRDNFRDSSAVACVAVLAVLDSGMIAT
jgi:hypothetical protein